MTDTEPLVSIVIPTFNSEKTISNCLQNIEEQTYKNIEVIVIDKNSSDNTINIATKFKAKTFRIGARERSEQMNFGVRNAKGEYVYIVGSDFLLEHDVVSQAIAMCYKGGYDAICIHNTSDPTVSFWSKVRKFERDMYKYDELNVAARFLKKWVFEDIGGFDEELVAAEDYDFQNRLKKRGFKIGKITAQEVHIGEPKTLSEIVRKHYYYGKTLRAFVTKNRKEAVKQLAPIRPAFLRHWKNFLYDPTLMTGFWVYQTVRYCSAALGYLAGQRNVKSKSSECD